MVEWLIKKKEAASENTASFSKSHSSIFFDHQYVCRTCFYADTAGDTLGRIVLVLILHHQAERTCVNTLAAILTFLFVDHINALCVLADRIMLTGLCTLAALYANLRLHRAFFLNNVKTCFGYVRLFVKSL